MVVVVWLLLLLLLLLVFGGVCSELEPTEFNNSGPGDLQQQANKDYLYSG